MNHTITVNAARLAQALKDATLYASKDSSEEGMNTVVLTITPQTRLAVLACDSHGYYENQLPLIHDENEPKPTLPGERQMLCIAPADALMLTKHISPRSIGCVTVSLNDSKRPGGKYRVTLTMPDGGTITIFCKADINVPDYNGFVSKAEASKEDAPDLFDVSIPVHEMIRASKVFPKTSGTVARMYTSLGQRKGHMALLEYQNDSEDAYIRVIFMFAAIEAQAA